MQNAKYTLVDLNGNVLLQGNLQVNKGEKTLDTRKIGQGTYLLTIYNNNTVKTTRKLVVQGQK